MEKGVNGVMDERMNPEGEQGGGREAADVMSRGGQVTVHLMAQV